MSSSITFYNYPKSSRIISHHISSPQSPLSLIITWGGAPLEPINVPWSSHGISLEDDDHTALPLRTEVSPDRAPPDHLPVEDDDPCRARQHPSRTSGSCQILGLKCHDLLGYDFKTHGKSMNIVEHHGIHMVESGKMNCWNLEMDLVEKIYIYIYFIIFPQFLRSHNLLSLFFNIEKTQKKNNASCDIGCCWLLMEEYMIVASKI